MTLQRPQRVPPYASFHAFRKPPSIVESVLGPSATSVDDGWAPFNGDKGTQRLCELDLAFLSSYAIGMYFVGHLGDRIDLRYFLVFVYWMALCCLCCWELCGKECGLIMGVWNSHTSVGNIVGSVIASSVLDFGWGLSFALPGVVVIVSGLLVFCCLVVTPNDLGFEEPGKEIEMGLAENVEESLRKTETENAELLQTGWTLPPPRSEKQLNLQVFITTLIPSTSSDKTVWLVDEVIQDSFSSRQVWECIREKKPMVPWVNLIWHKARVPRHAFSAWLFVLNRNPTLDRLSRWDCDIEKTCLLCGVADESRDHLFFSCPFSRQVWDETLMRLGFQSPPYLWDAVLQWMPMASSCTDKSLALLQAWQACIYEIWHERNRRFHLGVTFPARKIIRLVFSVVHDRALSLSLQNPGRESLLLCWC
ncbi:unnamed protein product [Microthlaspi erraticum]|uniref:Reverse transcriptase zinc-binding domain-containing protein n=1 Tax=Microthlaspi erraticum TaxID=1685480 RepID=A0A6D2KTB3_9BRAS|nr:unnamed protein product [Microthlaspi erraticum]